MKLSEILPDLKAPFPPECHVERDLPGGKQTWFFVPWQRIRDRLDEVCADEWSMSYGQPVYLDKFCVVSCSLTICGVTREALGNAEIELLSRSGKDMSRGTPIERAVADAFKNAAESFGIAAYLDEQSQDKREFLMRYLHSKGDSRAISAARKNEWIPGNLPTAEQKQKMALNEAQQRYANDLITEAQQKRLWAIARNDGEFSNEAVKSLLATYGIESSSKIPKMQYGEICTKLKDKELARSFNELAANGGLMQ